MGKKLVVLIGLAGLAAATYGWRHQLDKVLPAPLANAAHAALKLAGVPTESDGKSPAAEGKATANRGPGKGPPAKKGGGAAPVTVAVSKLAEMPIVLAAPGTVEALASVAIKPRVDGQVVQVGFKEGDLVTAGMLLYRLDDRLVRAQIKQAEAQIASDQASLKDAMSISDRRDALLLKKYASEAAAETARQQVEVLKAKISASQAALEMQRTQLDYLTIRAPITGRTGSITAKLGAFVRSADPLPLLTINQTKPITVSFALPQANLQRLKDALANRANAAIRVPGDKPLVVTGKLEFVDNQIDRTTGTVTAKVLVENADEALWPGLSVNVDLTVEVRKDIVSVPASAVLPAQQGMIVWVVGDNNKVSVRPVVQDRVMGQASFLTSGLKAGETVVTDGQLRLVPGADVAIRQPAGQNRPTTGADARGKNEGSNKAAPAGSAGGG